MTGEIRKVTESRGHHYLELADHLEGSIGAGSQAAAVPRGGPWPRNSNATLEVACWARDWPVVRYDLAAVGVELVPGLVVRVRGRVTVWEGASKLRFSMTALDVEALVGGIAAARRRLLGALAGEGILEANRRLAVTGRPLADRARHEPGLGGLRGLHRPAAAVGLPLRGPFRALERAGARSAGPDRPRPDQACAVSRPTSWCWSGEAAPRATSPPSTPSRWLAPSPRRGSPSGPASGTPATDRSPTRWRTRRS